MKIYYAHFMGIYNTKQEERDMELIKKLFPEAEVINPNNEYFSKAYKENKSMDVFTDTVRSCDILIFRGVVNGKIPAGVMKEINVARNIGLPILELPSFVCRELSVEDTREMLLEVGAR